MHKNAIKGKLLPRIILKEGHQAKRKTTQNSEHIINNEADYLALSNATEKRRPFIIRR